MPSPEVWGPATWNLFHTLAENINEQSYYRLYQQLFIQFQKICRYLPCPECSNDATFFLAKIKINNYKNKSDFKKLFYLFHNYVNAKKRKQLFNFLNINIYKNFRIINVINKFISTYNTKGNMRLLNESFQRQFVIKDFKNWFVSNITAFFTPNVPAPVNNSNNKPKQITENINVVESKVEEQLVDEESHQEKELEEHVVPEEEEEHVVPEEEEEHVVPEEEEEHVVPEEEEEEEHVVPEKEEEHVVPEKQEEHVVPEKQEEHVVPEEEEEEEHVVPEKEEEHVVPKKEEEHVVPEKEEEHVVPKKEEEHVVPEKEEEHVVPEKEEEHVVPVEEEEHVVPVEEFLSHADIYPEEEFVEEDVLANSFYKS